MIDYLVCTRKNTRTGDKPSPKNATHHDCVPCHGLLLVFGGFVVAVLASVNQRTSASQIQFEIPRASIFAILVPRCGHVSSPSFGLEATLGLSRGIKQETLIFHLQYQRFSLDTFAPGGQQPFSFDWLRPRGEDLTDCILNVPLLAPRSSTECLFAKCFCVATFAR